MHAPTPPPAPQSNASRHPATDVREPATLGVANGKTANGQTVSGGPRPSISAPSHTLILYTRPLHPELVQMKARKTVQLKGLGTGPSRITGAAEFEAWLTPLGHMLRYQTRTHCFCELVTDRDAGLPTSGVAFSVPAIGEKDHEQLFAEACVLYTTSLQTETLPPPIYQTTYREMLELADEVDALVHTWSLPSSPGGKEGRCLSMLELQRFDDEMHAQSTHMYPVGGLVLRTQTVFQRV
ncbi:MAG TPA: hypothetical protein VFF65_11515 [Phycisphaerales bacterium]|nr:hypothetical protein [Phycisphaerales bacterium]